MIVLDTNVVSELMRVTPSREVLAWTDRQAASTLFLSALTLAEIRFGLAALPRGKRRNTLTGVFEDEIRPMFGDRVLAFDEPASHEYAQLRATARSQGHAISDADALIAASARARNFVVATRDVMPFHHAGLRVINPFEAA
jgi:predicted nucleic acid-binding protein